MSETITQRRANRSPISPRQNPRPDADLHDDPVPRAAPLRRSSRAVPILESHLRAAEGDLWLARALALSERNPMLPACAARWLTPHEYDEALRAIELFALPSASQPGRTHLVRYDARTATVRCLSLEEALETLCDVGYSGTHILETGDLVGCVAGSFGRPCRHAGAAWKWIVEHDGARAKTPEQRTKEARMAAADEEYWEAVLRRERAQGPGESR